jgi:hypothetical protein
MTLYIHNNQAVRGSALQYYQRDSASLSRQTHLSPEVSADYNTITPHSPHHHSFFTQDWLTVSLDEAHDVGNMTRSFNSLMRSLPVALILTATPLHTGVSDLYNLGAMIGIPGLGTDLGYLQFQECLKEIAKT